VVITGGTGFIGARLARKLALYGASVTIPTRDRSRAEARVDPNIGLAGWTPTDPGSIDVIFAGADTVFHLAYDIRRSGEANVALYRGIADGAARAGVRRFIHASSIAVYDGWPTEDLSEDSPSDGPGTHYKLAKRAMERDLEARAGRGELDSVIIQPVNVYGPFSALWTDAVVERISARGLALPAGFDGLCNGVYVDDLVDAFIAAGDLPHVGARRFIVAGPAPIPWAEMFAAYAEGCGRTVEHEDWQPASEAPQGDPGHAHALKRGLDGLVMRASALLASRIGTSRVNALRNRLAALRPRQSGPYRPVQENPRSYLSRAVVHAHRAATELCPPLVSAEEGLARTKSYIRWRFGSPEK
jgi:nucleoside-diphosphate-sugar epimerase